MAVKKKIQEVNKIIDGVEAGSETIFILSNSLKDKAIDKTIELNLTKKPYVASSLIARNVDIELKKIIDNSNGTFEDFVDAAGRYLANNYAIKLTKKDLEAISLKGSSLIDDLKGNTTILKKDIQNILTQNLAKGVPEKVLVKSLKDLYPAYSRNASTIINTGLSRLFTEINVSKFQEQDFQWYIWAGPNDKITREIPCKHWVWHRFPASQLATITAIRSRLWNCRHSIIPISKEEIADYPVGNLKYS